MTTQPSTHQHSSHPLTSRITHCCNVGGPPVAALFVTAATFPALLHAYDIATLFTCFFLVTDDAEHGRKVVAPSLIPSPMASMCTEEQLSLTMYPVAAAVLLGWSVLAAFNCQTLLHRAALLTYGSCTAFHVNSMHPLACRMPQLFDGVLLEFGRFFLMPTPTPAPGAPPTPPTPLSTLVAAALPFICLSLTAALLSPVWHSMMLFIEWMCPDLMYNNLACDCENTPHTCPMFKDPLPSNDANGITWTDMSFIPGTATASATKQQIPSKQLLRSEALEADRLWAIVRHHPAYRALELQTWTHNFLRAVIFTSSMFQDVIVTFPTIHDASSWGPAEYLKDMLAKHAVETNYARFEGSFVFFVGMVGIVAVLLVRRFVSHFIGVGGSMRWKALSLMFLLTVLELFTRASVAHHHQPNLSQRTQHTYITRFNDKFCKAGRHHCVSDAAAHFAAKDTFVKRLDAACNVLNAPSYFEYVSCLVLESTTNHQFEIETAAAQSDDNSVFSDEDTVLSYASKVQPVVPDATKHIYIKGFFKHTSSVYVSGAMFFQFFWLFKVVMSLFQGARIVDGKIPTDLQPLLQLVHAIGIGVHFQHFSFFFIFPAVLPQLCFGVRLFLWKDNRRSNSILGGGDREVPIAASLGKWIDFICAPCILNGTSHFPAGREGDSSAELFKRYHYVLKTYMRMKCSSLFVQHPILNDADWFHHLVQLSHCKWILFDNGTARGGRQGSSSGSGPSALPLDVRVEEVNNIQKNHLLFEYMNHRQLHPDDPKSNSDPATLRTEVEALLPKLLLPSHASTAEQKQWLRSRPVFRGVPFSLSMSTLAPPALWDFHLSFIHNVWPYCEAGSLPNRILYTALHLAPMLLVPCLLLVTLVLLLVCSLCTSAVDVVGTLSSGLSLPFLCTVGAIAMLLYHWKELLLPVYVAVGLWLDIVAMTPRHHISFRRGHENDSQPRVPSVPLPAELDRVLAFYFQPDPRSVFMQKKPVPSSLLPQDVVGVAANFLSRGEILPGTE